MGSRAEGMVWMAGDGWGDHGWNPTEGLVVRIRLKELLLGLNQLNELKVRIPWQNEIASECPALTPFDHKWLVI